MGWVLPLTHSDPDRSWTGEFRAYDGDLATSANTLLRPERWSGFLELMRPLIANTLRVWMGTRDGNIDQVEVEVEQGGRWKPVYCGGFPENAWRKFTFNQGRIQGARLRFRNSHPSVSGSASLYELEFFELEGRGLD